MSRSLPVTAEQVAAARLRIVLDAKLHRPTPSLVRRIAAMDLIPEPSVTEEAPMSGIALAHETAVGQETPGADVLNALGVDLDAQLMTQALTHRSYAYEHGGQPPPNERLEFLGDAVLGMIVTDRIYRMRPDLPEGQMAKLRASVVNMHALANVARGLGGSGLGKHLLLGRGEEQTGGWDKPSILADGFEAVLGAVYLQHGHEITRRIVHELFDPLLTRALSLGGGLDWKTSLRDLTASVSLGDPQYLVQEQDSGDHTEFTVTAVVDGQERGHATGPTKRDAEQKAAELAWKALSEQGKSAADS